MRWPGFDPCIGDPCMRSWQPTSVFLPGESPWTKEPGGLLSMGWQSQTCLSDLTHTHEVVNWLLGKEMTTHSSILAWKVSRTEEPGEMQTKDCKESHPTKHTGSRSLLELWSVVLAWRERTLFVHLFPLPHPYQQNKGRKYS